MLHTRQGWEALEPQVMEQESSVLALVTFGVAHYFWRLP